MSKKTPAYGEGYTAGQAKVGLATNPYNETEQPDQYSEFKTGYADGLAERDEPIEGFEDTENDNGDYEDDEDEDEDDY